jgi:hypothetical protein
MSAQGTPSNKKVLWAGRVVSALPVLMLLFSGSMKLSHQPKLVEGFVGHFGYPEGSLTPIGVVEILSAVLYAIPQTTVVGAALITAYLGGAVATHVRVGENGDVVTPIVLGILVWLGIYLRDERFRVLAPLRKL